MTDPADALYRDLPDSLTVYPHQLDLVRDNVMLIRLTERDYADASFLDRRLLAGQREAAWFTWDEIAARMGQRRAGTGAHFIFHVGHCGSTLISRLLGELGVIGLREPLPLRTLAEVHAELGRPECRWSGAAFEARLVLLRDLFDRGQGPRSVKATSFCNDLAAPLLQSDPARRATIVCTGLRAYLANVLAGPNSRLDLLSAAPLRLKRLTARAGRDVGRLAEMSQGVISAMSWATEMSALAVLLEGFDDRVAMLDFDRFLADVRGTLRNLAEHVVAGGATAAALDAATSSAWLTRYSKAPEYAYDADLRQRVLADGERQFGDEIRRGLAWCEQTAGHVPSLARALELFDRAQSG